MKRRQFLTGAAAVASTAAMAKFRPARAQNTSSRRIIFVAQSNLNQLDPVFQTGPVERQYNHAVWDMLYALDSNLRAQPQMAAGHTVSSDGLTWRITLRDGLMFHDGTPVRSVDCIPSITRWSKRDGFGQRLFTQLDSMRVVDDKSFEVKLTKPFPFLAYALTQDCMIMPERLAKTDAFQRVTEYVGSGPFRFIASEYVSGSQAHFERFDKYVPRQEAPSYLAGGKQVYVDRVEWKIIPDGATAAGALQKGEVDWIEEPIFDLLPLLRSSNGVKVTRVDPYGATGSIQFNFIQPPFDNAKLRLALLPAINQRDFVDAVVGSEDGLKENRTLGVFPLGTPLANTAGLEPLTEPRSLDKAKRLVAESGYKGEPVVLLAVSDISTLSNMAQVTADVFRKIGLNVRYENLDLSAFITRRANKESPDKGGWSCCVFAALGLNQANPGIHLQIRTNGPAANAGWPDDKPIEDLRTDWFNSPDLAAERVVAEKIQREAFGRHGSFVPLCQWYRETAYRANISGALEGNLKVFWNVKKA